MCHLAIAQFHCGYIDQSARMSARALATARRLGHANTLGYALFYAGVLPRYNRREFTLLPTMHVTWQHMVISTANLNGPLGDFVFRHRP